MPPGFGCCIGKWMCGRDGNTEELMKLQGKYHKLFSTQAARYIPRHEMGDDFDVKQDGFSRY